MSTKKNAGRKRGGKKSPKNLDDALFGDYHGQAIDLVMQTRERMSRIPEYPDPSQEQDRLDWFVRVGGMIVEAIMKGDKAALPLFEGIAKVLKDGRVSKRGDWKTPVDAERTEAALIVMRQYDERPERSKWHLPPMTVDDFGKQLNAANPKAGDRRRTVGRMMSCLGAKKIPGKRGRPKK
jgi:hypothetical protein